MILSLTQSLSPQSLSPQSLSWVLPLYLSLFYFCLSSLFSLMNSDELMDIQQVEVSTPRSRVVNLILDHSAFVRGLGNIKRWFSTEYVRANLSTDDEATVNLFIPSYALHEFEYLKRGTSMLATNSREAIKFIDEWFEKEDTKIEAPVKLALQIESPGEAGPKWIHCLEYQKHIPKIKEFPNYKTKFDSNLIGRPTQRFDTDFKSNDIQYENSKAYQNAVENAESDAEMPARLKYMVRTCIYKRYIEKNSFHDMENWKVVTEDPITKIWLNSFGIDCLNVNEAELLMFKKYDVNAFNTFNPHNTYKSDDYDIKSNVLHNTIDTTLYQYDTQKENRPLKKKRAPKKVTTGTSDINGETVKKERFGAINYAPRGKGELWKP